MSLVKISTRQLSRRKRTGGATGYIVEYDDQTHPGYLKRCCGYAKIPTQLGHGIPHNWGIFYALGVALAMEGVRLRLPITLNYILYLLCKYTNLAGTIFRLSPLSKSIKLPIW